MWWWLVVGIVAAILFAFDRRTNWAGLRYRVVDGLLTSEECARLRAVAPTRDASPSAYPDSLRRVSVDEARRWSVPLDEHYLKHGVLVDSPGHLAEYAWLADRVGRLMRTRLYLTELRLKTHLPKSNGVWVHTDRRTGREILVLFYLTTLKRRDGGALYLFSHDRRPNRGGLDYDSGRPIAGFPASFDVGRVGGERPAVMRRVFTRRVVIPRVGRAVVLDHRHGETNLHAVSATTSDAPRVLVEAWFKTASDAP